MEYDNPWLFDGKPFNSVDIGEYYGFVYQITNKKNGKSYIGKKFFWHKRKNKKGRRSLVESDWKTYYGSSKVLLEVVKSEGKDNFRREIISLHVDQRDINYSEVKTLFLYDVLETRDEKGERIFYNGNIASKYFVNPDIVSEETRRKMSKSHKGYKPSDETRYKISLSNRGKSKLPSTEVTGIPKNKEYKEKNPNILKTTGNFVTNNSHASCNWVSKVLFSCGIELITNFKQWCIDNDIKYPALIAWSKKHSDDNKLHPKYGIKFISIERIN